MALDAVTSVGSEIGWCRCPSVSSLVEDYCGISDVCFSLPTVIDCDGIERVLHLQPNEQEQALLKKSVAVLKNTIAALGPCVPQLMPPSRVNSR